MTSFVPDTIYIDTLLMPNLTLLMTTCSWSSPTKKEGTVAL